MEGNHSMREVTLEMEIKEKTGSKLGDRNYLISQVTLVRLDLMLPWTCLCSM